MSTYEVGQVWSNDNHQATITNVATSYDDSYIRYMIGDKQYEMNMHTFSMSFPNTDVVTPVEVVTPVTLPAVE